MAGQAFNSDSPTGQLLYSKELAAQGICRDELASREVRTEEVNMLMRWLPAGFIPMDWQHSRYGQGAFADEIVAREVGTEEFVVQGVCVDELAAQEFHAVVLDP